MSRRKARWLCVVGIVALIGTGWCVIMLLRSRSLHKKVSHHKLVFQDVRSFDFIYKDRVRGRGAKLVFDDGPTLERLKEALTSAHCEGRSDCNPFRIARWLIITSRGDTINLGIVDGDPDPHYYADGLKYKVPALNALVDELSEGAARQAASSSMKREIRFLTEFDSAVLMKGARGFSLKRPGNIDRLRSLLGLAKPLEKPHSEVNPIADDSDLWLLLKRGKHELMVQDTRLKDGSRVYSVGSRLYRIDGLGELLKNLARSGGEQ